MTEDTQALLNRIAWLFMEYAETARWIDGMDGSEPEGQDLIDATETRDEAWAELATLARLEHTADPFLEQVEEYADLFERDRYSSASMGVIWGCDCGCGGDSLTESEIDAEREVAGELRVKGEALLAAIRERA